MTAQQTVFRAKDGAVIDLEGLKALGQDASRYLDVLMSQSWHRTLLESS